MPPQGLAGRQGVERPMRGRTTGSMAAGTLLHGPDQTAVAGIAVCHDACQAVGVVWDTMCGSLCRCKRAQAL